MAEGITELDSPIDAAYLIHKALRAEGATAEKVADELEAGTTLQSFKLVFNSWATALVYHAELDDIYVTSPLISGQLARRRETENVAISEEFADTVDSAALGSASGRTASLRAAIIELEDGLHKDLVDAVQEVFTLLNEEIGNSSIIPRTKQHLFGQVVALRITQEDHLETEEVLILPAVREQMSDRQQLKAVHGLLIDEEAEDPRWIIDWVAKHLDARERKLLADLEARFEELSTSPK